MEDLFKNIRVHLPVHVHRQLAHLAVDLPGETVSSLMVQGARLVLAKHGCDLVQPAERG